MNYLIADLNIKLDGHKYGFVQNIIDYLSEENYPHSFYFLVNKSPEFVLKDPAKENIRIICLTDAEQSASDLESKLLKKSSLQWQFISAYCSRLEIDRLILMELDLYQVALGRKASPFEISGIWFRPHCRSLPEHNTIKDVLKHKLWMIQKEVLIRSALRNRNLQKVFVLNDNKVVDQMNHRCHQRFFYLPDPVFDYPHDAGFNVRKAYDIEEGRVVFLLFGYIDERKNVQNIIRALNTLEDKDAEKVCLLIIGKFAPGFQKILTSEFKQEKAYQVVMNDQFVSDSEMESVFEQCDVSLRMNINFFGSSGIIGTAAKYNKPSIVSDFGIVAELTEKYKLGELVDPYSISGIKEKILYFLAGPQNRQIDGQAYYKAHDREAYVKTLLDL